MRLKTYDMQETFHLVVRHLSGMKRPAAETSQLANGRTYTTCSYLTPDNERCAFGILFDADDATLRGWLDAEGRRSNSASEMVALVEEPNTPLAYAYTVMVNDLQGTHDDEDAWGEGGFIGTTDLLDIAKRYGLDDGVVRRHFEV